MERWVVCQFAPWDAFTLEEINGLLPPAQVGYKQSSGCLFVYDSREAAREDYPNSELMRIIVGKEDGDHE